MTELPIDDFTNPPPARRQPMRWRRALRAFRALMDDPDDTARAHDFFMAIGARDFERSVQRFVASPSGRELLRTRSSLLAALEDWDALAQMPDGSLGRAYLDYMNENGFATSALPDLWAETQARWERDEGTPPQDPVRAWVHVRLQLCHDLYHVVTGYGTDSVGEATLLAFTLAQQRGRANTLLTLGAALELLPERGMSWLRYDFRAWRRGRRAEWIPTLPFEELLPLPLETVRALAGIEAAAIAHPGGILRDAPDSRSAAA